MNVSDDAISWKCNKNSHDVRIRSFSTTWVNGYNQFNELSEILSSFMERYDSFQDAVLLFDSSGLGCGLASAIMEEMSLSSPSMNLSAINILSNNEFGLSHLNSALAIAYCLEFSSTLQFRTYEDTRILCNESFLCAPLLTLQHIHSCIASDISAAYCCGINKELRFHLQDLASYNNKLVDVRSSLWRPFLTLMNPSKAQSGRMSSKPTNIASTPSNPMRDMATNVHALHLANSDASLSDSETTIHDAHIINFQHHSSTPNHPAIIRNIPLKDAAGLLHWAAPNMTWPTQKEEFVLAHSYGSQAEAPADSMAILMTSPYARQSARRASVRAENLCTTGAYVHKQVPFNLFY